MAGISLAVPSFMMGQRYLVGRFVEIGLPSREQPGTQDGMLLHDLEFVDVQPGGLFQYQVRYRHLAHVMKHGGHAQDVPFDVDFLLGNAAFSCPGLVDFHGVSRHPVDMGAGLLRVPHFRHADHAKKNGPSHLRTFQRDRGDAGEVGHHLLVFPGEFNGIAFGVHGVDDLQDAENVPSGRF